MNISRTRITETPEPASCDLRGNHFEIEEGVNTVPEYAGVYLMCRGLWSALKKHDHEKIMRKSYRRAIVAGIAGPTPHRDL